MTEIVEIKIDYSQHIRIVLTNLKTGNTFTFDPNTINGENLIDFLS